MKKIFPAIIVLFGFSLSAIAATPSEIAQAWKERGFVAVSRLDSLSKKNDKKSRYQLLLEFAFATHAAADKSDELGFVHKTENGLDFYKIILNKSKNPKSKNIIDDAGLFSINYVYDHQTGEFIGAKIELLPKGWYVHAIPTLPNSLLLDLNDNHLFIIFDLINPMNSYVDSF